MSCRAAGEGAQDSAALGKANAKLEQGKASEAPERAENWKPASWQSGLGQPWDWIAQNTDLSAGLDLWALKLSAGIDSGRVAKALNFSLFAVGLDFLYVTFGSDKKIAMAKKLIGVTHGIPPILPPNALYCVSFTFYLDGSSVLGFSVNAGVGAFIQPKLTDYRAQP